MIRYTFALCLILSFSLTAQYKSSHHPMSGKLLFSLDGGVSSGQTDYRQSVPGYELRGGLEKYFKTNNRFVFGLRIFGTMGNISGKDNAKYLNSFSTNMYSIGAGGVLSYSFFDVLYPYTSLSLSHIRFNSESRNKNLKPEIKVNSIDRNTFGADVEVGIKIPVSELILLNVNSTIHFLRNDFLDNASLGLHNDFFINVMGGISISLSGKRDSDGDNIPDDIDACKNLKEDYDGYMDNDGCPDLDNDKDGIADISDKCPNESEDLDSFQDDDGCPDPDNDNDGIADVNDKCPDDAEDIDNFEDSDGCPDLDNDLDGIPDSIDKCPNDPETKNDYLDDDGCPDVVPKKEVSKETSEVKTKKSTREFEIEKEKLIKSEAFTIHGEITFQRDNSIIKPDAYGELDRIAGIIKQSPNSRWRIEGYMDPGSSAVQMSTSRAQAIYKYFISKGLSPSQFSVIGMGDKNPIEDNDKVYGRMRNRRVVVKRIE